MNIAALLEQRADERPRQAAIIEPAGGSDRAMTFDELRGASASLAARLRATGVGAGDHVLLLTPISRRLYVALLGALRIGAVPVVVDPGMGVARMRRCLRRARPKAVLGTRWTIAPACVAPELRGAARLVVGTEQDDRAADVDDLATGAPALLTFTSGSTGDPRAVVRSHGLLLAQHRALAKLLDPEPGDVSLATLPIFVLTNLAAGVTSVLADARLGRPGFIRPAPVLRQMARHRPRTTVASPSLLLRLAGGVAGADLGPARFERVFTGGAPVFPDMIDRIATLTGTGDVVTVYGSSEAEPIAHLDRLDGALRGAVRAGGGLPVGPPIADVDLRILADRWGEPLGPLSAHELDALTLGDGACGEIVVAGDHVVAGYLDGAGDEVTKIRCGDRVWHRTGDAGRIDASGRLWLLGRCSAALRAPGAEPIYPFPIEAMAREATGRRTAFIESAGRALLCIEGSPDPTHAAVIRSLDHPAARTVEVRHIHAIPLDPRHNAKVDEPRLRAMLGSPSGRR